MYIRNSGIIKQLDRRYEQPEEARSEKPHIVKWLGGPSKRSFHHLVRDLYSLH
jgi:hypothetical protein